MLTLLYDLRNALCLSRRYTALIWTSESLIRSHILKVLDLNMLVETINVGE